jgi:hypothetical protein
LKRTAPGDEDFQFVLMRYGAERLMYRLSQSEHATNFVLKGAMLFLVWTGAHYRATKDMAEKFEAMVKLGLTNGRMKDFYDIWALSREFDLARQTYRQLRREYRMKKGERSPVHLSSFQI